MRLDSERLVSLFLGLGARPPRSALRGPCRCIRPHVEPSPVQLYELRGRRRAKAGEAVLHARMGSGMPHGPWHSGPSLPVTAPIRLESLVRFRQILLDSTAIRPRLPQELLCIVLMPRAVPLEGPRRCHPDDVWCRVRADATQPMRELWAPCLAQRGLLARAQAH